MLQQDLEDKLKLFKLFVHITSNIKQLNHLNIEIAKITKKDILETRRNVEGATLRFVYLEISNLNFSTSSFQIRFNLLHPLPFLFLIDLLLSLYCVSILLNYDYFQVSFDFKVIFYVAKKLKSRQNTVMLSA